ncbi:MAG: heavy metal-binding domain-containing protein [Coriobacteriia bacterium]|nr:heavy metal-binding domain-containing protein [Coriobacteriia bacterium]
MRLTGLSGNEIYCLKLLAMEPGNLVIGNSVFSMGLLGGLRAGFSGMVGGEVADFTSMIAEGRAMSLKRLQGEIAGHGGNGATGVTSELVFHPGNIEFLSIGSTVHVEQEGVSFTSSSDGQELYCQMDCGYMPLQFVFGNVAYSIGVGNAIMGGLKTLGRGEIAEYTDIFYQTRHHALSRIIAEAQTVGANAVVGIRTTILPFGSASVQEMLMLGTASHSEVCRDAHSSGQVTLPEVVTSDMTCEEMWNMAAAGYVPMKLVIGTSVYSLGLSGGITAWAKNFVKGEIPELTSLIYEARERSLARMAAEAQGLDADDIVGIKTYVYSLGSGLIEFLAIGTAVKLVGDAAKPRSPQLPPQAIVRDKDTFINTAEQSFGVDLNAGS